MSWRSPRAWGRAGAVVGGNAVLLQLPAWFLGAPPLAEDPSRGVFLLGASLLCLGDLAAPERAEVLSPTEERSARAYGSTLLAVGWTGLASSTVLGAPVDPLRLTIGLGLMLLGSGLRHAAVRSLGAGFRTGFGVPENSVLVRKSVHRFMRHPAEAGILLASLGGCIVLASGLAVALWAVALLPVVVARSRQEDAALAAVFGRDHAAYTQSTGMFAPRLSSASLGSFVAFLAGAKGATRPGAHGR